MYQGYQDHHPASVSPHAFSSSAPQDLQGVSPMLMRRSMSFSGIDRFEEMGADDDMSDDGSQLGEKKRRLNLEQVKGLEKSFELGNKLEPDRKMQLARALGLQPRQIAIWFQNRRARWKTKQLERDYGILKRQFEALKADNDALKTQNKKLQGELLALKGRESIEITRPINLNKETDCSWSNGSNSDVNTGTATRTASAESPPYSHPITNKYIFTSSIGPTSLFQISSPPDLQGQKINQTVPDESFCTMFGNIDDQPGFWPWPDQHNFH